MEEKAIFFYSSFVFGVLTLWCSLTILFLGSTMGLLSQGVVGLAVGFLFFGVLMTFISKQINPKGIGSKSHFLLSVMICFFVLLPLLHIKASMISVSAAIASVFVCSYIVKYSIFQKEFK